MDIITIKIEDPENLSFFLSLLQKFNFIKEVTINKNKLLLNSTKENAPIEWADKHPSMEDFSGIWSDRSITIDDIRNKSWKRN
ncbi:MAG: hypothetical protein K8F24_11260 [Bacteroidales bacterium]|nr:hypothetical protein [Bacteroidales bacterium]